MIGNLFSHENRKLCSAVTTTIYRGLFSLTTIGILTTASFSLLFSGRVMSWLIKPARLLSQLVTCPVAGASPGQGQGAPGSGWCSRIVAPAFPPSILDD